MQRRSPHKSRVSEDPPYRNDIPKRYNDRSSQFKVHFYVRRVPMSGMNEDEFLWFIRRKSKSET